MTTTVNSRSMRRAVVSSIRPIVQRMIAIDALLAGDGLIIDVAAEELGVVGRSVRRSLDILRELAGPTVFEIDETTHDGHLRAVAEPRKFRS